MKWKGTYTYSWGYTGNCNDKSKYNANYNDKDKDNGNDKDSCKDMSVYITISKYNVIKHIDVNSRYTLQTMNITVLISVMILLLTNGIECAIVSSMSITTKLMIVMMVVITILLVTLPRL